MKPNNEDSRNDIMKASSIGPFIQERIGAFNIHPALEEVALQNKGQDLNSKKPDESTVQRFYLAEGSEYDIF